MHLIPIVILISPLFKIIILTYFSSVWRGIIADACLLLYGKTGGWPAYSHYNSIAWTKRSFPPREWEGGRFVESGGGARRYIGGSECNEEEEPILKSAGSMVYGKIM